MELENSVLLKQCYMCDKEATSVEHVPPKCLFPEIKDSGVNFRVNLITVPSCDEHNCHKSHDDEFLMVSIAGIIGNNSIGYQHANGKIQRALKRSSYKLLEKVFLRKHLIQIQLGNQNKFLELIVGTPDCERLINCFTHIAYGIHRHHFKENFKGIVTPYLAFLYPMTHNSRSFRSFLKEKVCIELAGKPKHGENPKVFYYQFTDKDEFGIHLVKLCFYQNVDVYVSYKPTDTQIPYDLGLDLVSRGIKTIITLGDKEFIFNKN